jgi:F-type H+-transporting ATPase subunit delta
MAGNQTLARPYARAAFETARAANALGAWSQHLALAAAIAADPRVTGLLGDPRVKAEELPALFLPPGESAESTFGGFIGTLAANRRLPLLPEIHALYEGFKREHERVLHVVVRTAVAIEPAQADALRAALKRRFQREIELETRVDAGVIGGAVIDAGDTVIDGSVRGGLARLAQALTA